MLRVNFGLTLLIGAGLLLVRLLSQLEWWQRKEYRLDRVWATLAGEESLTIVTPLFRLAIATTVLGWINVGLQQSALAEAAGMASVVLLLVADAHWILRRGVRRPKPSLKVGIIGVIVVGLLAVFGSSFLMEHYFALQLATVALLLPLLVGVVVQIVNFPVRLQANNTIEKARERRRQHARVKVIGITGSYGKTSTKYFLQQLLQDTPGVIATAAHRNSPLPVARDILQQLNNTVTTYIVEMAAYRRGEIRELCTIVLPQIGVVTAIGNQHVALFGSLEALAATKWELIDSLPSGGTAVLNADDPTIVRLAAGITRQVIWYSLQEGSEQAPVVYVSAVTIEADKITAQLHLRGEQASVAIPLVSRALLGSAVAAAAGALALGVAPHTIFRTIQKLHTMPRTMELKQNSRGASVIDDSYSANETGAVLAIEHLATFTEAKKIIVLTPLIELGAQAKQVHERIGQVLARSNATVYVTNSAYQADILRGGKSVRDTFAIKVVSDPATLAAALSEVATSGSVVLLEGRLPDVVRMKVIA